MQLSTSGPEAYTSGLLLGFEIGTLLLLLVLLFLVTPVLGIYFLYKRRWRDLGRLSLQFLIGFGCLYAAVAIDAPTLLYAT